MPPYIFTQIEFLSPEYDLCIKLRDKVLRKPLKLEYTLSDLEQEYKEFHFGLFNMYDELLGCLSLKPLDRNVIKMRQVAIEQNIQGRGLGTFMVKNTEEWAIANKIQIIELHARDSAIPFYTKLAYEKVGEIFFEVNIPHCLLVKKLYK